jgi:membrane protein YdbS with pleckstrin-like domain
MKKKREKDLTPKIRVARRAYLFYYLMAFIIAGIIIYTYLTGGRIETKVLLLSGLFILLIIKFVEIHRMSLYFRIGTEGIEVSEGIFIKSLRRIGYGSVSDLDYIKNPWQRILGIGTVSIHQFEHKIVMKDVINPEGIVEQITEVMKEHRLRQKSGKEKQ